MHHDPTVTHFSTQQLNKKFKYLINDVLAAYFNLQNTGRGVHGMNLTMSFHHALS